MALHYDRGQHLHHIVDVLHPEATWANTPLKKKWIQSKRDFPDHIVFAQNGKFFEFYHEDADVVTRVVGSPYMTGEVAMTGFPLCCYSEFVDTLKKEGYKGMCII